MSLKTMMVSRLVCCSKRGFLMMSLSLRSAYDCQDGEQMIPLTKAKMQHRHRLLPSQRHFKQRTSEGAGHMSHDTFVNEPVLIRLVAVGASASAMRQGGIALC